MTGLLYWLTGCLEAAGHIAEGSLNSMTTVGTSEGGIAPAGQLGVLQLGVLLSSLQTVVSTWEYLRAINKLYSLVWDSYEAIVAACKAAWDFLLQDPDRIRSIGQRDWACVKV